jgi:ubiquinone/menaquinone biosynthesis C-methylase UbiE
MVQLARARVGTKGTPNCTFIVGHAYDLAELVAEPVDLVLIANTFHGVPDKERLAHAVAAVSKPRGRLSVINWPASRAMRQWFSVNHADQKPRCGWNRPMLRRRWNPPALSSRASPSCRLTTTMQSLTDQPRQPATTIGSERAKLRNIGPVLIAGVAGIAIGMAIAKK